MTGSEPRLEFYCLILYNTIFRHACYNLPYLKLLIVSAVLNPAFFIFSVKLQLN